MTTKTAVPYVYIYLYIYIYIYTCTLKRVLSRLADVTRATLYPRPDEILRLEIISKLQGELTKHLDIESTGKRVPATARPVPDEIFLIDDVNVKRVLLTALSPGRNFVASYQKICNSLLPSPSLYLSVYRILQPLIFLLFLFFSFFSFRRPRTLEVAPSFRKIS